MSWGWDGGLQTFHIASPPLPALDRPAVLPFPGLCQLRGALPQSTVPVWAPVPLVSSALPRLFTFSLLPLQCLLFLLFSLAPEMGVITIQTALCLCRWTTSFVTIFISLMSPFLLLPFKLNYILFPQATSTF